MAPHCYDYPQKYAEGLPGKLRRKQLPLPAVLVMHGCTWSTWDSSFLGSAQVIAVCWTKLAILLARVTVDGYSMHDYC